MRPWGCAIFHKDLELGLKNGSTWPVTILSP